MTSRVMAFVAQEPRLGDMEEVSRLVRTADGAHTTGGSRAAPAPHRLLDRGAAGVFLIAGLVFLAPAAAWIELPGPARGPMSGSTELRVLVGSALLALVLPLAQIATHARVVGGPMIRGNRDDFPVLTGLAARIPRAHANLIESLVPFATVVLAGRAMGLASTRITVAASVVFLAARVVHAGSYAAGIVVLRSAAFYAGLIATLVLAAQLPLLG
jgi:uncharacterized MAPEG superfamily protein